MQGEKTLDQARKGLPEKPGSEKRRAELNDQIPERKNQYNAPGNSTIAFVLAANATVGAG